MAKQNVELEIQEAASAATGQDAASYERMLGPVQRLEENPSTAALMAALREVKEEMAGLGGGAFYSLREEVVKLLQERGATGARKVVEAEIPNVSRTPKADQPGEAMTLGDPEPWGEEVNGTKLLTDVEQFVRRFAVLPEGGPEVLATFVLATHAGEAFRTAPYVALESPTPECGKTRVLEILALLCRRPWLTLMPSQAVLFRVLELFHPTMLLDECQLVFGRGESAEAVRALLLAGYKRGATVPRCVGDNHEVHEFEVFGPKVFALIGELGGAFGSRCIRIGMQRRRPSEALERFTPKRTEREGLALLRRAWRWAQDHRQALEAIEATLTVPAFINDRLEEIWTPLLAVAAVAGGDWEERLVAASRQLATRREDDVREQLLADIRDVFGADERLPSAMLVERLRQLEARPWAEYKGRGLSTHSLAALLKHFKIKTKQLWIEKNHHGYERSSFADAWERYLMGSNTRQPPVSSPSHPPDIPTARPLDRTVYVGNSASETARASGGLAVRESSKPTGNAESSGLAIESHTTDLLHDTIARTRREAGARREAERGGG